MRSCISLCFLIPFILISITGCIPLVVGGAVGALGGYAISKDTVQGDTDKPYDSIWPAALMAAKARGAIKQQDQARGYIELDADSGKASIRLIRLTRATTRLRIKARNKYHLPNLDLAQDLFVKIMDAAR